MKQILHKIFATLLIGFILGGSSLSGYIAQAATTTATDDPVYTTLRSIDLGTFNEYRYKITEQFFALREYYEINEELNIKTLQNIAVLADTGYRYLPDNLKNKNYLKELLIEIQKGIKSPTNEIVYNEIVKALAAYLENVEIQSINGTIEATPLSGNAPITTTFRAKVQDPSGTQILSGNYTWWIDREGTKVIIGRGSSLNYTFKEEGKYSVFLDVTSSHKNADGYTDILPFRSRVEVSVNEKIASVMIKVNGETVVDNSEIKFTPGTADYGLLFDATSSIPTSGTKFSRTEWDFGNGIKRSYSGSPKIERIRYGLQGEYQVSLRLTTNEGKVVIREFVISVRDPIAKIEVNREDGYVGDAFTFSAKAAGIYRDLTYTWEILDIDNDKIVFQKNDKTITYSFANKGRYNVQLKVRQSSGEVDQDTRIVYVTSQTPVAEFETKIPQSYKPNRVFFDASRSFDPDVTDDGKLKYDWFIDGNKVNLESSSGNGSVGYYVFNSVGTHSVTLEVTDPDGIMATKKNTVQVDSILSVDMFAFPRVIQRNGTIKFVAQSPEAKVFEWNFGDGKTTGGSFDKIDHIYETSGTFDVTLKVSDSENNTNTFVRKVYVSDSDTPYSLMNLKYDSGESLEYDENACNGEGAYIADRAKTVVLDGMESININGQVTGLDYSWKIGQSKFVTTGTTNHRFDEIGCFPVKLSVTSQNNSKSHASEAQVEVRNLLPTLTSLSVQVENPDLDPLIVRVNAVGAADPDGIIQSYLWYYYTDLDANPQDFRSTATPSTAFVIPKVTGNYYFVAILKDNNEARVTSEEITGSRYFTTVTGDNINTPIIELSVTDNSTIIGEEITFTAKASNILGQTLEKDVEYSWDFDGDGFYDTQSKEPNISYIYKKSGEFYAKVKVKYKGISSTRNITMNVSNKLIPDFEYISIGNTFIFFDTSSGLVESREWDLGDGTKKTESSFEYTFDSKSPTNTVKLKVTEGTTVKEVEKEISKNFKNIIKTKAGGLVLFTSPEIDENGKVILEDASKKFFVYMGESDAKTKDYVIDYDIQHDSDLNGSTDDDENNKGTASYISGNVIEIPLNPYKNQKVRIFLRDETGKIIASQDLEIEKPYIEEVNIDPNTIIFEGVSDSEKEKIEALKAILIQLPQEQKLKALTYVQKLQENWNDETEKTRTILDFEGYIFELALKNEDEVISLLESLLVEGQEDQSAKQITYQALVNLIPKEIVCTVETGTCYDMLLSKLGDIKASDDVETNKVIGKEILEVIGATELLTNQQKIDFKAILASLVYGGDIAEIPEAEKQEVMTDTPSENTESSGILSIAITLLKVIGYILGAFLLIVGILYGAYMLLNKDKGLSFTDFITRKTTFTSEGQQGNGSQNEQDILAEFLNETPTKEIPVVKDPLINIPKKPENPVITPSSDTQAHAEDVPDWLKGSFSTQKDKGVEAPKLQDVPKIEVIPAVKIPVPEVQKPIAPEPVLDIAVETQLPPAESQVPDWLKGSFDTQTPQKQESQSVVVSPETIVEATPLISEADVKPIEDSKDGSKEKIGEVPATDIDVPDWLKGSFDVVDTGKQEVKSNIPVVHETLSIPEVKTEIKKEEKIPSQPAPIKNEVPKKETLKKAETPKKGETSKTKASTEKKATKTEKKDELWDDGMKIPDWLKSDDNS